VSDALADIADLQPHHQSELRAFQSIWRSWAPTARSIAISLVALRDGDTAWLQWATVRYLPNPIHNERMKSASLDVEGICLRRIVSDLPNDALCLDHLFEGAVQDERGEQYRLPKWAGQSMTVFFYRDHPPQSGPTQSRSPTLWISARRPQPPNEPTLQDLEHAVRVLDTPYDGLQDLLNDFGLSSDRLRADTCTIEIVLGQPAETILARSKIDKEKLHALVMASQLADPRKLKIGARLPSGQGLWDRVSVSGDSLSWTPEGDFQSAVTALSIPNAGHCQVLPSYDNHFISRWWIVDSSKRWTARATFLGSYDGDFGKLRTQLLNPTVRGHEFERVVTLLLELLGFNCIYLGDVSALQDAPDIYCETPSGRIGLIECAVTVLAASEKMSKLQQRAERFRSALKEAGLPHVEVLPILLTRQPRVELNPFAGDCVRFGVLLGGHDHIEELSAQLGLPSDPEALYQRAADSLKTLPSEQDH